MIVAVALALLAQVSAPSSTSSEAVVDPRAATIDTGDDAAPSGSGVSFDPDDPPPVVDLPSDDQLRLLAQRDIGAARPTLRRAARTAERAGTRALAVRLLATNDASVATARICARALRLDIDANVRRAGAECLGRVGPRLGAPHTPALLAALDDPALDVVTMAGWGLANVGDAAAVVALNSRVAHPDVRVGRLFHGYTLRLRERLGLTYAGSNDGTVAPRPSSKDPTAVPPGVVLTFNADGLDGAAALGWLGVYGAMAGWVNGPLLVSAHGGPVGADNATLVGLGAGAVGASVMSAYAFSRADTLPKAHTVVQLGTFGMVAGYGAGQLAANGPASGVLSSNLSLLGTVVGTGMGMVMIETTQPTVGALTAGMAAGLGAGTVGATLAAGYGHDFDACLGALLVTGGVAGAATTVLLAQQDIGLFPVAGAGLGMMLGGGTAGVVAAAGGFDSETSGWLATSGVLGGAALGGIVGWLAPRDIDPLLAGTLKLDAPTIGFLPGRGVRAEPVTMAMLTGSF